MLPATNVAVVFDLQAADAASAIEQLAAAMNGLPGLVSAEQLVADVLGRESCTSTFLGDGVALPHARTDAVTQVVVAVGRSLAGVPFWSRQHLAHLVVLIGCPRADANAFLETSKLLLGKLHHARVREQLLEAKDETQFRALLGLASGEPKPP